MKHAIIQGNSQATIELMMQAGYSATEVEAIIEVLESVTKKQASPVMPASNQVT
ncbi:hypothetical protein [Limosilactobacillus caecicola]|uniref:hypothetical protein n=1 Tax=Limosilactobacillus caecicola TaxID=2941332 RepID=UPI00203C70E5|nr:hypothetical protein [Limosilactobacillus caecicola]